VPCSALFWLTRAAHQSNAFFRFGMGQQKIFHGQRADFRRLPVENGGDIGP